MGGCTAAVQSCVGKRRLIITMKDLAKKAAKNRRMVTFAQLMGCLGSGACAAAVGTACVHAGVFTAGTACLAAAGVMGTLGCADAVKSCVGKRRLMITMKDAAKNDAKKRRMVTLGQLMGCLGSGACAAAVAAACVTEGVVTVGTGCLAAGGVLATIGCTAAVQSCVGKRRHLLVFKAAAKRKLAALGHK